MIKSIYSLFEEKISIYSSPNLLLEYKCSSTIKSTGFTKLMKWVMLTKEYPELLVSIKELLELHPETLNEQNTLGWSALMLACGNSRTCSTESTVKMLIDAGTNLNLQNIDGSTALKLACMNSRTCSTESTVQILINAGANLNLQNINCVTALMLACENSRTDSTESTVQMLINAGANLNLQNINGVTALMCACENSRTDSTEFTVQMLINAGANLNLTSDGLTALMLASRNSKKDSKESTVQMLIDAGSNLNLQDKNGDTELIASCKNQISSVIKMLIEAGANIDIQNNDGNKAFSYLTKSDAIESYINALLYRQQIEISKQFIFKFVLKNIIEHRNIIIFHPNNIGYKISKLHFDIRNFGPHIVYKNLIEVNDTIIDYLNINSVNDMTEKVSQYLII